MSEKGQDLPVCFLNFLSLARTGTARHGMTLLEGPHE